MSRFVVNLDAPSPKETPGVNTDFSLQNNYEPQGNYTAPEIEDNQPKKGRGCLKILVALAAILGVFLLIGGVGAYFYWQSLKKTPQYSLALIVDAARNDDKQKIEQLLNTDQVIDGFVPQITDKAVELYGKNLPAAKIAKVSQILVPMMPAVKDRVRAELPRLIREKTQPVASIPTWLIAIFAERAVEIKQDGDTATVKSKIAERPLELTMKRNGDLWQIVAVKDEVLARQIAEKIGQEVITAATKGGLDKIGKQNGVNIGDAVKSINDIFK